ncbi:MAG: hypothetical protein OEV49_08635 [candidate division Zixibacteria bacterium]|nr:hypothetical protein [candidate division Zixibacteria bacterium]MDH3936866.1 hypothetical protein [candidate division Zixibacteria bacterium]
MPFKSLPSSNRRNHLLTGFLCPGASSHFLALGNVYETLWLVSFVALVLIIRNDWFDYPDGLSPPPANCA